MQWTYKITAASRPKVLMRVAQVFDQQLHSMSELMLADVDGTVTIHINVDVSADLAHRIQAKLYSQLDVRNVDLAAGSLPQMTSPPGYKPEGDGWTRSDDSDDESYSGGVNRPSTAVQPPSTIVSVPVTNEPASEAR